MGGVREMTRLGAQSVAVLKSPVAQRKLGCGGSFFGSRSGTYSNEATCVDNSHIYTMTRGDPRKWEGRGPCCGAQSEH